MLSRLNTQHFDNSSIEAPSADVTKHMWLRAENSISFCQKDSHGDILIYFISHYKSRHEVDLHRISTYQRYGQRLLEIFRS